MLIWLRNAAWRLESETGVELEVFVGSSSGGSAFEEAEEAPGEKAADEGFRRRRAEEIGGRQRHFMTEVITVIDD
jgi:hypothetical protein